MLWLVGLPEEREGISFYLGESNQSADTGSVAAMRARDLVLEAQRRCATKLRLDEPG